MRFVLLASFICGLVQAQSEVEKLLTSLENIVAIGQTGQLCAVQEKSFRAEQSDLGLRISSAKSQIPQLEMNHGKLLQEFGQVGGIDAKERAVITQIEREINELKASISLKVRESLAVRNASLKSKIAEAEACAINAKQRLSQYVKPPSAGK